jgi:hypothetical protein
MNLKLKQAVCGLAGAVLLAGCGGAPVVEADPVIAGKRYVNAPVSFGPVKMMLRIREGAPNKDEKLGPENFELSLGFLAAHDTARVVLSSATLSYGADGKVAEPVTRNQAKGSAQGCTLESSAVLGQEYWFNATVNEEFWNCVTIGFVTPGRLATDALELRMEPLNVNGELIRALPITFAVREPE